jgi:cyclophilin family peptidyl-prolyl cis-trans isomerase/photosystem II stability/assembly factor-like uncharacterized protein
MPIRHFLLAAGLVLGGLVAALPAQDASPVNSSLFAAMKWRAVGPHRASRTVAAAGHRSQPHTFYMAAVNGGIWKTTDAGRTWAPIFDDQPTGSIGSLAVAPSDPNVVYAGSGEGLHRPDLSTGDGVYKSSDAGKTWTHQGLRDAQQIPRIDVDPRDANRVFVAALGHPYGPNAERGIFRSIDGGRSFQKVLYKDENVGGNDVDIDPANPDIVYATLWEERQGPWENAAWAGTGGGIFKSTDGGTTWTMLTKGLPAVVQANLAISASNPRRLYATVAFAAEPGASSNRGGTGIFRSDDAGESWTHITTDARPAGRIGGGDLPMPLPDPKNPDRIVIASTVSWVSTDGGKTWAPFKGAPGGEDYQNGWINPDNPDIMLLTVDQGAVVTLNGGQSWSSWYNQPTAALYHVAADNAFPYRVCSGQQESGSVCISSRGNYGAISERDWLPVGVDEYGYVAPDPLDLDIVYGGRSVTRFDRRTGQTSTVGPIAGRGGSGTFRSVRTMPVLFSDVDKRTMFFANNVLWKTTDGGAHWTEVSGDLTRKTWETPASVGKYAGDPSAKPQQRGVIYTVAPSHQDMTHIWIGTDDGLIQMTADGGRTWNDVTPSGLGAWAKVSIIDAGRFSPLTAYAAINTIRLDDMRPSIYGKTWTAIVTGIPDGETVNVVREDPARKGLLFAGTERSVYVSFNDGAQWQSLRLNLPASSIRDLIVKDDDLVVATHGRGFWILDDITPLRQVSAASQAEAAILFKPSTAWRVRWDMSTDMPWPIEEPTGKNPPDGAIIDYYLGSAADGPVTLEILQQDGRLVRRYSSSDPVTPIPAPADAPVPTYWYRTPQSPSTSAGMHRFMWDVHYQPLPAGGGGGRGGLSIAAIPYDTGPTLTTPWVAPGTYTVKLTAGGKSYTQPIMVRQDPRVKTPALAMQQVYSLTRGMYFGAVDAQQAAATLAVMRVQAKSLVSTATGPVATALAAFEKKGAALEGQRPAGGGGMRGGGGQRGGPAAPAAPPDTLWAVSTLLAGQMNSMQAADVAPTSATLTAVRSAQAAASQVMARWNALRMVDLPALNATLKAAGLPAVDDALLHPEAPEMNRRAPDRFRVRLLTSKGPIVIEVTRAWAPHGADRFFNLVRHGYYDQARFFRVIKDKWAQFGIHAEPRVATLWRNQTIPDDPAGQSNVRGTVAFAFAVPNGCTTQVFINLRDNSATHDKEPFVPFGLVVGGMDVAEALNSEYGESSGSGIRAGKQDPLFDGGNAYLAREFPRLDFIRSAVIER